VVVVWTRGMSFLLFFYFSKMRVSFFKSEKCREKRKKFVSVLSMAAVVTGLSLPDSPEPPDPPDPPSTLTILATSVSIVVELSTLTDLDLKVTQI